MINERPSIVDAMRRVDASPDARHATETIRAISINSMIAVMELRGRRIFSPEDARRQHVLFAGLCDVPESAPTASGVDVAGFQPVPHTKVLDAMDAALSGVQVEAAE